ncbi:LANO_0E13300g1_1 [Lachancea nothofagi CBS 11611]|uniref:LANO_0E13300g1_1 n=1 Tax=Lachancea nothofagi CBS 11611 TaxID=1266666 RepID=A0A1G4JYV0_9SACH|nr:LANO_0E13300g1_1 [Lachancea nothofagi CBS 11611]
MKRSFCDDQHIFETKKTQLYTSGSGVDAFRTMLMSARHVSRSAFQEQENHQNCYYCDSHKTCATCETCHQVICSMCSLGGTDTCLNCSVSC